MRRGSRSYWEKKDTRFHFLAVEELGKQENSSVLCFRKNSLVIFTVKSKEAKEVTLRQGRRHSFTQLWPQLGRGSYK